MRTTPTAFRRIGASAVAGVALVAAGAVMMVPALASHTGTNGAVRSGPDLVFVDCVDTAQTTSTPDQAPATDTAGRNAQAAQTGSGCTVQGSTSAPTQLTARFTFDGQPVPGRVIRFTISADGTASGSGQLDGATPVSGSGTNNTAQRFCATDGAGQCVVTVSSTEPGVVTVLGDERDSGQQATENVEFRRNNSALTNLDETHRIAVKPNEDDYTGYDCVGVDGENPYTGTGGTPGNGTNAGANGCAVGSTRAPSGTPGRPVQVTYQLLDRGSDAGPIVVLEPQQAARPLTNRTVRLTLSNPEFFFTPNCGPVSFGSASTVPNAPDYRQCSFRQPPVDGNVAGLLKFTGTSIDVKSDDNGLVTVTVATESNPDLNADGTANVQITAIPLGQYTGNPNVRASEPGPNTVRLDAPLNFNTRNRPLNGIRVSIECMIDTSNSQDPCSPPTVYASASDALPTPQPVASSSVSGFRRSFRPLTATSNPIDRVRFTSFRVGVFLEDQFNNLVRVPETDVSISATGAGVELLRECTTAGNGSNGANFGDSVCTDPAAANTNFATTGPNTSPSGQASNPVFGSTTQNRTTGSFKPSGQGSDFRRQDPFRVRSNQTGPVTLSATWHAPLTVFNGGGVGSATNSPTPATASPTVSATSTATATPTATSTATPTATATASPTVSPTSTQQPQRFASRVSLVASHSRVTAGNGPRLSGQVFDQNGQPLGGVNLTFFEKSFGERFYSQTPGGAVTSGFDGRFSVVVHPFTQTSYGVNTDDGRANSNIVQIRVNARMDITSPAPSALVSNPVTLSGRILPAYNNRPIGLAYIDNNGRYVYLGQSPTRDGAFSVRSGGRVPSGTFTFVVYMSPTQGTDRGARSLRLTVR